MYDKVVVFRRGLYVHVFSRVTAHFAYVVKVSIGINRRQITRSKDSFDGANSSIHNPFVLVTSSSAVLVSVPSGRSIQRSLRLQSACIYTLLPRGAPGTCPGYRVALATTRIAFQGDYRVCKRGLSSVPSSRCSSTKIKSDTGRDFIRKPPILQS